MNKTYSTEVKMIPTRHIMEYYWPRDGKNQNIRVSNTGIHSKYNHEFLMAMISCQIKMLQFYLPTMSQDRAARAKKTLRTLINKSK